MPWLILKFQIRYLIYVFLNYVFGKYFCKTLNLCCSNFAWGYCGSTNSLVHAIPISLQYCGGVYSNRCNVGLIQSRLWCSWTMWSYIKGSEHQIIFKGNQFLYLNADWIQSLNSNFYTRFIMSMCWKMRNIVHEITAYILLNSAG